MASFCGAYQTDVAPPNNSPARIDAVQTQPSAKHFHGHAILQP